MYYALAAVMTQNQVLDIGPGKALLIATQLAEVSEFYPVQTKGPVLSVIKLVGALAFVNAPIMIQLAAQANARRQARKPAATPATPETIVTGMTETRRPMDFNGDVKMN